MLFVELALIRWTAAYNIYVAYFTNFVLLGSFLGIGVGFLRARGDRDLSRWAPAALATAIAFIFVLRIVKGPDTPTDLNTVFNLPAPPIWLVLPMLFVAVVASLATIAEGVGRRFVRFEPLDAYRLDIVGSLTGIVAFSALSFLRIGPVLWGLVIVVVFLILMGRPRELVAWGWLAAVLLVFAAGSFTPNDTWSPYYRVTVRPVQSDGRIPINVNSLAHQSILPMDQVAGRLLLQAVHAPDPGSLDNVLIVGAGSGNDVALALEKGAKHVDAVEIDPVLQHIGVTRNPAHPYQDPRVSVHINDGRAFLERTDSKYDLILFALPDSLTLVSGQSSLRLESYLFTQEAMESVRDHLKPGGAFAMYNYYTPFVFERYANTMDQVFGHEPCFDPIAQTKSPRQQAVLTIGLAPTDITCTTLWTPGADVPAPSTDDREDDRRRKGGARSMSNGFLALEDGTVFPARSVGAPGVAFGEAVFTTAMTGYQETVTDPSFAGQLVAFTAPMIGNYGVDDARLESTQPWVKAALMRRCGGAEWAQWLASKGIVALEELDTRKLVLRIREAGAMRAAAVADETDLDPARARADPQQPSMEGQALVSAVSSVASGCLQRGRRVRVAVVDYGAKTRSCGARGGGRRGDGVPARRRSGRARRLRRRPALERPRRPGAAGEEVEAIRGLLGRTSVLGICLGHQLLGLATGHETYKLPSATAAPTTRCSSARPAACS